MRLPKFFRGATPEVATQIPPAPIPRPKSAPTVPSFVKSAAQSESAFLPETDMRLATTDSALLRLQANGSRDLIRKLSKASPDLSAAVFAAVRMAVSRGYQVVARDATGTLNVDGTRFIQQFVRRMDYLDPSPRGVSRFNSYPTVRSVGEQLGRELLVEGACSCELVLGRGRVPEGFRPLAASQVKFKYEGVGKRKVPYQKVGSDEVSLDVPTFFYVVLDQDLLEPYSDSPLASSVQPIQASMDFQNDLRRVFRRAIHPRLQSLINFDSWIKQVPPEILHSKDDLKDYMDSYLESVRDTLNGLNPEDALVSFDTVKFDYLVGGNNSLSQEYEVLSKIINGKLAAGAKAMPTVLGQGAGSQNIASTESMLYVKSVEGAVQFKLNEIFSRMFTAAARLFGLDVVIEFEFEPITLRPEIELEAFKSMEQARVLEQLSLGMITDEEAAIQLTGSLPAEGAPRLSGTMFSVVKPDISKNPTSNTSNGQGSALNQGLNSSAPDGAKSKNQGG